MYLLVVPLTFHEVKVPQTVGLSSLMTDCLECWASEDFLSLVVSNIFYLCHYIGSVGAGKLDTIPKNF